MRLRGSTAGAVGCGRAVVTPRPITPVKGLLGLGSPEGAGGALVCWGAAKAAVAPRMAMMAEECIFEWMDLILGLWVFDI